MTKTAIIYTRVSTKEQADNGFSLAHQEKMLRYYCDIKNIQILQHFQEDYSAKNFDRPQWKMLVEYVKLNKKNIDLVLCLKWDRFSRNHSEADYVIKQFRKTYGIEINTVEQPIDFTISDTKLMLAIYLSLPEIENDKNSQRTIAGSRQARLEGCWTGTAPFGYKNKRNDTGKSTLEVNAQSVLVARAFDEFSKGVHSAEQIRKNLRKEGLKLSKSSFLALLRNVVYTGKIFVKEEGKAESLIVDGIHEAIIDEYTFQKVQQILSGRKKQKVTLKSQNIEELPLRGLLRCKKCGGNLTGSKSKGRKNSYYYYHCNNNACKERFRADWANLEFEKNLACFYFEPELIELYGSILENTYKQDNQEIQAKMQALDRDIAHMKVKISNIQDLLADEKITSLDYSDMKKRYENILNDLIMRYTEISMYNKSCFDQLRFGTSLLKELPRFYSTSSLDSKRLIIGSIFPEKLEFDNGKYRTNHTNSFFSLMAYNINELEKYKMKNASISTGVFCKAPPSGLEPETL